MSKINAVCSCLTEKFGLKPNEAEEFATELFAVIRDNISADGLVKVKGLGTFKLSEVSARESVDVNTGARITIEGRNKVSFTPEAAVRDRINAPFSQFESFEIDDSAQNESFESIDEKYDAEETVAEPVKDVELKPEPVAEPEPEPVVEPEPEPEPVIEETPASKPEPEPVAEEQPIEPMIEIAPDAEDEEKARAAAFEMEQLQEDLETSERKVKRLTIGLSLLAILFLCLAGFMVYYVKSVQAGKPLFGAPEVTADEVAPAEAPADSLLTATADTLGQLSEPAETVVVEPQEEPQEEPAKAEQKPAKAEQKPAVEEKPVSIAQNDLIDPSCKNDVRLRTGAYNIVGISRTYTVRKGQTISDICKHTIGRNMECYVKAVNGGRTEFLEGEKIKIPKLELKKKSKK